MKDCVYVDTEGFVQTATTVEDNESCPLTLYGFDFASEYYPETMTYQKWNFSTLQYDWLNSRLATLTTQAADAALADEFIFNSVTFSPANVPVEIFGLADQARWEDPASVRKVAMKNDVAYDWTNATLIAFVDTILNFRSKVDYAKYSTLADIASDTVNTPAEVTTAFNGYMSSYTNTRTQGPTIAEIEEALEGVTPITPQAYIGPAATNAATNAPENLDPITTLLGTLTGRVNDANGRYNDLAVKYNDLATKFNTLKTGLIASGLMDAE